MTSWEIIASGILEGVTVGAKNPRQEDFAAVFTMFQRTGQSLQRYTRYRLEEKLPGKASSLNDVSNPVGFGLNWITVPHDCAGLVYRVVGDVVVEALEIYDNETASLATAIATAPIVNITSSDDGRLIVVACSDGSLQAFDVVPEHGIFPRWRMDKVHSHIVDDINKPPSTSTDYAAAASGPLHSFGFAFLEYIFLLVDANQRKLIVVDGATKTPINMLEGYPGKMEALAASWYPTQERSTRLTLAIGDADRSIHVCVFDKTSATLHTRLRIPPPNDLPEHVVCSHVDWFNDGWHLAVGYCGVKKVGGKVVHEPLLQVAAFGQHLVLKNWQRIEKLPNGGGVPDGGRHVFFTSSTKTERQEVILLVAANISSQVVVVMNEGDDEWTVAKLRKGCSPSLTGKKATFPVGAVTTFMPKFNFAVDDETSVIPGADEVLDPQFLLGGTDGTLSRFTLVHDKEMNFFCPSNQAVTLVAVEGAVGNRNRRFLTSGLVNESPFGNIRRPVGSGFQWVAVPQDSDGAAFRVSDGLTIEAVEVSKQGMHTMAGVSADKEIARIACSSNGRHLAAACLDGSLRGIEITLLDGMKSKWKLRNVHSHVSRGLNDSTSGPIRSLCFSGDHLLLADSTTQAATIFDATSVKPTNLISGQLLNVRVCCAAWMAGMEDSSVAPFCVGDAKGRIHFCAFHRITHSARLVSSVPFPEGDAEDFVCSSIFWLNEGRTVVAGYTRKLTTATGYAARLYGTNIASEMAPRMQNGGLLLEKQSISFKVEGWSRVDHVIRLRVENLVEEPSFMVESAMLATGGSCLVVGCSATEEVGVLIFDETSCQWAEQAIKDQPKGVTVVNAKGRATFPVGIAVTAVSEVIDTPSLPQSLLMVGMDGTLSRIHVECAKESLPKNGSRRRSSLFAQDRSTSLFREIMLGQDKPIGEENEKSNLLYLPSAQPECSRELRKALYLRKTDRVSNADHSTREHSRPLDSSLRWIAAPSRRTGIFYRVREGKFVEGYHVSAEGELSLRSTFECSLMISHLTCSDDGFQVAGAFMDGTLRCFDVTDAQWRLRWIVPNAHSHRISNVLSGGRSDVRSLAFRGQHLMLVDSARETISIYDALAVHPIDLIKGAVKVPVRCAAWSTHRLWSDMELSLAVGDAKGCVGVYGFDPQSQKIRLLSSHSPQVLPASKKGWSCTYLDWFDAGEFLAAGFQSNEKVGESHLLVATTQVEYAQPSSNDQTKADDTLEETEVAVVSLTLSSDGRRPYNALDQDGSQSSWGSVLVKSPFYEVCDFNGRRLAQSDVLGDDSVSWRRVKLDLDRLCRKDFDEIFFLTLYDWERDGRHRFLGRVATTLRQLLAKGQPAPSFPMVAEGVDHGQILVRKARIGRGKPSSVAQCIDTSQLTVTRNGKRVEFSPTNNHANAETLGKWTTREVSNVLLGSWQDLGSVFAVDSQAKGGSTVFLSASRRRIGSLFVGCGGTTDLASLRVGDDGEWKVAEIHPVGSMMTTMNGDSLPPPGFVGLCLVGVPRSSTCVLIVAGADGSLVAFEPSWWFEDGEDGASERYVVV